MKSYVTYFVVAFASLGSTGCQNNQADQIASTHFSDPTSVVENNEQTEIATDAQQESLTVSRPAEKQPEQTQPNRIPDISSKLIEPTDLIGIWSWVGNPSQGIHITSDYKYNLMTFHPQGQILRSSALDPENYDGMTQVMTGNGQWETRNGKVEVGYQMVTARDTTRIIQQYPGVEIIPGVATTQVRQKYHTFEFDGEHLVREDGSRYERISSDPEADGKQALKQAVDNKNYRNRHMIEQYKKIYSSEYGY